MRRDGLSVADPGIGTRGGSIDLLTALDLLGKAEQSRDVWRRSAGLNRERTELAEARVAELEAALAEYANPQHWGIDRTDFQYPKCVWIGPGADQRVPNAPEVARAALAAVRQEGT
jgi:hypothetical protein